MTLLLVGIKLFPFKYKISYIDPFFIDLLSLMEKSGICTTASFYKNLDPASTFVFTMSEKGT